MNAPITNASGSTNRIDQTGQPPQSINMAQLTGAKGADAPGMMQGASNTSTVQQAATTQGVNRLHQYDGGAVSNKSFYVTPEYLIQYYAKNHARVIDQALNPNATSERSPLMAALEPSFAKMFQAFAESFEARAVEAIQNPASQDTLAVSAVKAARAPFENHMTNMDPNQKAALDIELAKMATKLMAQRAILTHDTFTKLDVNLTDSLSSVIQRLCAPSDSETSLLVRLSGKAAWEQLMRTIDKTPEDVTAAFKKLTDLGKSFNLEELSGLGYHHLFNQLKTKLSAMAPEYLANVSHLLTRAIGESSKNLGSPEVINWISHLVSGAMNFANRAKLLLARLSGKVIDAETRQAV